MHKNRLGLLKQLKAYGVKNDIPNISWDTAEFLHTKVQERNPNTVLEIGTANGFSTIWIADALSLDSQIVTIERSAPSFRESIQNFQDAGVADQVASIYGDAKVILSHWGEGLTPIQYLDRVPKGPQYLQNKGLLYSPPDKGEREGVIPLTFDLVFIDAQKIHYETFWNLIQPLLTDESWVIVDDVLKFGPKTQSFTDLIQSQDEWQYEVFQTDADDGIMVCRKK